MSGLLTVKYESIDRQGNKDTSKHHIGESIMENMETVIEGTVIEVFTRVVARTPIKTGALISSWEVYVGTGSALHLIDYRNTSENTPLNWSKQKASEISNSFKEALKPHVQGSMPVMRYKIESTITHAPMVENGGYAGRVYKYVVKPYYVFPTPFRLTSSGFSLKSLVGMVQVAAIETEGIFQQKLQGGVNGV